MKSDCANILVFCVNQSPLYCPGCNGHPVVRTPSRGTLAARRVNFNLGYGNHPVHMPRRAAITSGKTPHQQGLLTNGNILSPCVPTVTQTLADPFDSHRHQGV